MAGDSLGRHDMSGLATNIAASVILTASVGLYFGIIMALFGLLALAGTAGRWALARAWLPAFSEHLGVVVVILGLTFRWTELALLGLLLVASGRGTGRAEVATVNSVVEASLITSALVSLATLALLYGLG